jgi:hypothetical protein
VAMAPAPSQQSRQVLQGAPHGNSQELTHTCKAHTSTGQKLSRTSTRVQRGQAGHLYAQQQQASNKAWWAVTE